MSDAIADLEKIFIIRETPIPERDKFLFDLSEYVKSMPSSYEFYTDYILWLVSQSPKALMPWEEGFEDECKERVVRTYFLSTKGLRSG